ncbi:MAG: hypothetical protein EOL97_02325 [Spirochaetia bacterium]|nr:hypothetical protein [Spirochaetia bacterium]
MSEYDFERERERARTARWNAFFFIIICAIVAYIFVNFPEYKSSFIPPKNTEIIVNENLILENSGLIKIHDFRNNEIFDTDENLKIEVLQNNIGFLLRNNQDLLVGAFIDGGWYSLEIIPEKNIENKVDEQKEEVKIEDVKQSN